MAAGEGRRLRPLSERWPKPTLPIDGRPVVATIVRQLAAAGCGPITVVIGHLGDRIEALLGDGAAFGSEIRYGHQPKPHGSADAVAHGLRAGARPPLLVSTADTVFAGDDVTRFTTAFVKSASSGAIAVRQEPAKGAPVEVVDGRVARIGDVLETPYVHASLWGLKDELLPYLDRLPGPPFELADAYRKAINEGAEVSAFEVRRTRDLTDPLDLVVENFPYLGGA